eukprot:4334-Heterococcus_DN1.PRE.1
MAAASLAAAAVAAVAAVALVAVHAAAACALACAHCVCQQLLSPASVSVSSNVQARHVTYSVSTVYREASQHLKSFI